MGSFRNASGIFSNLNCLLTPKQRGAESRKGPKLEQDFDNALKKLSKDYVAGPPKYRMLDLKPNDG